MKLLGLAIASAIILLIPSSAKADWVYVTSISNKGDIFVEDSSIEAQGNRINFWQMDILRVPFKGKAKRVVTHYALNCSQNTMTTIASTPYNKNGKPLNDPSLASIPGRMQNIIPGTAGYEVKQMVCGN